MVSEICLDPWIKRVKFKLPKKQKKAKKEKKTEDESPEKIEQKKKEKADKKAKKGAKEDEEDYDSVYDKMLRAAGIRGGPTTKTGLFFMLLIY